MFRKWKQKEWRGGQQVLKPCKKIRNIAQKRKKIREKVFTYRVTIKTYQKLYTKNYKKIFWRQKKWQKG